MLFSYAGAVEVSSAEELAGIGYLFMDVAVVGLLVKVRTGPDKLHRYSLINPGIHDGLG